MYVSKESFKTEHECEWSLPIVMILMEHVKPGVSENYGEKTVCSFLKSGHLVIYLSFQSHLWEEAVQTEGFDSMF